ncbi:HupE/UreJ family protein [uncultured Roseibium sp.]|uniref:HupE/UreJ family protein n=1 Tax=uncultured Roseibium sp. TaxID=1936171 RepID=UPI0032171465
MSNAMKTALAAVGITAAAVSPTLAHTGGLVTGFGAGVSHPVLGADHLLAMVAVGLWSAAQPREKAWQAPVLFMLLLVSGAGLGLAAMPLPFVEAGILASIFGLAVLLVAGRRIPSALALTVIGIFAVLHGHAHGSEAAGAIGAYMAGFLVASAALHLTGYGVGRFLVLTRHGLAASGLAVLTAGLVLAGG